RRIRSVKNAERVRTARMRAPYGMRKMRYGVAQPLALRLSVCGRALRALRLQLRRLTRWGTSCQCCRHFGILESDKSRATLFEREDALPVVLHADDEPAVLLRLVVERLRERADLRVGQPLSRPIGVFAFRVIVQHDHR